jgi:predicted PurR-regulated permease PerM
VIFFLLATITIILFAAVLKITAAVVVPFTLALFLALVTSPLVKHFEKLCIPRVISVFLILILIMGGLVFMGMVIFRSGRSILTLYPRYEARITEIYIWVAQFFELPYDEHLSIFDNIWGQVGVRNRVRTMTLSFSNAFLGFLTDAFMVVLFVAFLLFEAVYIKDKLDRAFEGLRSEQIIRITSDIMTQVSRYLSMKFLLSMLNGVLVGIGLSIIGVEFAIVWGVIQFVTNFIPNIGTIMVAVSATVFSLIQFWPNPMPIIATAVLVSLVNGIVGFVVDPKVIGDRLGLSPLVIIVCLMVWGWIWGFAGMILAVPMTAIIKIVCENIPVLEPISILLGSRRAVKAATIEEPASDKKPSCE